MITPHGSGRSSCARVVLARYTPSGVLASIRTRLGVMVKRYDPTRATTVAMSPGKAGGFVFWDKEADLVKAPPELSGATEVASFNYYWRFYKEFLECNPDLIIYQSEATVRELLGPYFGMDREKMVGIAYWGAMEYWGESNGWPKKGWNYSFFSHTLEPYPQAWLIKSGFEPEEPIVRIGVVDGGAEIEEWNDNLVGKQSYTSSWNFPEGSISDRIMSRTCCISTDLPLRRNPVETLTISRPIKGRIFSRKSRLKTISILMFLLWERRHYTKLITELQ